MKEQLISLKKLNSYFLIFDDFNHDLNNIEKKNIVLNVVFIFKFLNSLKIFIFNLLKFHWFKNKKICKGTIFPKKRKSNMYYNRFLT
jgi:hypothetical protein